MHLIDKIGLRSVIVRNRRFLTIKKNFQKTALFIFVIDNLIGF